MKIAEAYVEIKGDYKKFRSELTKEGKSAGQQVAGAFAQAFAAAAFTAGVAKSINAANRLQQAVGATEAVFGSAGRAVKEFADTSAQSFGISASAARELTAQIGALLQGMGFTAEEAASTSVELAQLGADLAATFGGKPEAAVQALGAALRGERDPIERYGISLNEAAVKQKALELGLYDGVGALDANGRAQATLALITERSAGAQGQFARESTTAAGAQAIAAASAEDAAASFGEVLLPVYTRVVEVAGALAGVFGKLPAPVQTAVVALAGLIAFQGPIRAVVTQAKALEGVLGKIGVSGKTAAAGLGVLTGALVLYELHAGEAEKQIRELASTMDDEFKASILDSVDALSRFQPGFADEIFTLGDAAGYSAEELVKMTAPTAELQARLLELAESDAAFRAGLEETGITLELLREIVGSNAAAQQQYEATMAGTQGAAEDLGGQLGSVTDATVKYGLTSAEAAHAADELTQAIEGQEQAQRDIYTAIVDSVAALVSAEDATFAATEAVSEYNASLAEQAAASDDAKMTAGELRDELESTRDSILDAAAAQVEMTGASLDTKDGIQLYIDKIRELSQNIAPGSPVAQALDGIVATLEAQMHQAEPAGQAIGKGLMDGIAAGIRVNRIIAENEMAAVVRRLLDRGVNVARIRSPSKESAERIGEPLAEGIAVGIEAGAPTVRQAMADLVTSSIEEAEDLVDGAKSIFDGLWDSIDDERHQERLQEGVSDANDTLADARRRLVDAQRALAGATPGTEDYTEAQEDLADAQERVEDAERRVRDANLDLLESSQDLIDQGPEGEATFAALGAAAGLTEGQVRALIQAYKDLKAAQGELDEANAANPDAPSSTAEEQLDARNQLDAAIARVRQLDESGASDGELAAAIVAAAKLAKKVNGGKGLDWLRYFAGSYQRTWDDLAGIEAAWAKSGFDAGGVVPGPIGSRQVALVHGGETILPTHRQGVGTLDPVEFGEAAARAFAREMRRMERAR